MKKLTVIILILSMLCSGLLIGCNNVDNDYDKDGEEYEKEDEKDENKEELTPNEKKIKVFAEYLVANEYAKAIEYYQREIWGNYELETAAEDQIMAFCKNVNSKILSGEYTEKEANNQLAVAERVLEAIEVYPDDYDDILMSIKISFFSKEAFSAAQTFENEKKYVDAFIEYKKVIENDCNYLLAQEGAKRCLSVYKENIFAEVKTFVEVNDYVSAINILRTAANIAPDDSEITAQLSTYETTYIDSVIAESEKVFVTPTTDYNVALSIINAALQTCPTSEKLNNKKTYYSSFVPVNLYDVEPIKGELDTDEFVIYKLEYDGHTLSPKPYNDYAKRHQMEEIKRLKELSGERFVLNL